VFGRIEIRTRERLKRESGKRDRTSPVWKIEEIVKRCQFHVGPMLFFFFAEPERKMRESFTLLFFSFYALLCFVSSDHITL